MRLTGNAPHPPERVASTSRSPAATVGQRNNRGVGGAKQPRRACGSRLIGRRSLAGLRGDSPPRSLPADTLQDGLPAAAGPHLEATTNGGAARRAHRRRETSPRRCPGASIQEQAGRRSTSRRRGTWGAGNAATTKEPSTSRGSLIGPPRAGARQFDSSICRGPRHLPGLCHVHSALLQRLTAILSAIDLDTVSIWRTTTSSALPGGSRRMPGGVSSRNTAFRWTSSDSL